MCGIPNRGELRAVDRVGDVRGDCLHVGKIMVTDDDEGPASDLAETADQGRLEDCFLLGAGVPRALLELLRSQHHGTHCRSHLGIDVIR